MGDNVKQGIKDMVKNKKPRIIEKKWWPDTFQIFASGKRKIEPRIGDFKVRPGDIVLAREWNPKTKKYTGREVKLKVKIVERSVKNWPWKYYSSKQIKKHGFVFMVLEKP